MLTSARVVCRRTVSVELVHNVVDAAGKVYAGVLRLSSNCVHVVTLWIGSVPRAGGQLGAVPV